MEEFERSICRRVISQVNHGVLINRLSLMRSQAVQSKLHIVGLFFLKYCTIDFWKFAHLDQEEEQQS